MLFALWMLLWQNVMLMYFFVCLHMFVTTCFFPDPSVFCLCECSWRATWQQVSERLCRGSCWRWRVCTARSAPVTPSSRLWFAGSAACSDSPKAEAHTEIQRLAWNTLLTEWKPLQSNTGKLNYQRLSTLCQFAFCSRVLWDVDAIATRGAYCVTNPNYVWRHARSFPQRSEKKKMHSTHEIFTCLEFFCLPISLFSPFVKINVF